MANERHSPTRSAMGNRKKTAPTGTTTGTKAGARRRSVSLDAPLRDGRCVNDLVAAPECSGSEVLDAERILAIDRHGERLRALLDELPRFPTLTLQQREVLGAYISLTISTGAMPRQREVAAFLGWHGESGRALVKTVWRNIRLRMIRAALDPASEIG
jgi:hypothetical protein